MLWVLVGTCEEEVIELLYCGCWGKLFDKIGEVGEQKKTNKKLATKSKAILYLEYI